MMLVFTTVSPIAVQMKSSTSVSPTLMMQMTFQRKSWKSYFLKIQLKYFQEQIWNLVLLLVKF